MYINICFYVRVYFIYFSNVVIEIYLSLFQFQFVFPVGVQHAKSTGLLFVLGLYGPLDEHGALCSGRCGSHAVNSRELSTMVSIIEEEDILAVYVVY